MVKPPGLLSSWFPYECFLPFPNTLSSTLSHNFVESNRPGLICACSSPSRGPPMTNDRFVIRISFGLWHSIPVLVRVLRGKNLPCSSLRVFQDLCGKKFPGLCNRKCCTHLRTRLCSHLRRRKPLISLVCHTCHSLKSLPAGGSPWKVRRLDCSSSVLCSLPLKSDCTTLHPGEPKPDQGSKILPAFLLHGFLRDSLCVSVHAPASRS